MTNLGMKELMATKPETLARQQRYVLLSHVRFVFEKLYVALENNDTAVFKDLTFHSPAGDKMGSDNTCINFTYGAENPFDIADVAGLLGSLDMAINPPPIKKAKR